MQGQANHFVRYAPEKIEYGVKRYTNETRRLYGVIEKHLSDGREWLAAGQYTIADMANFSWVFMHEWAGKCCTGFHACRQYCSTKGACKRKLSMPECLFAYIALHDKAAAADAAGSWEDLGRHDLQLCHTFANCQQNDLTYTDHVEHAQACWKQFAVLCLYAAR